MSRPTATGREPGAAPRIHPTALVDSGAELAEGVSVGPYAIIGNDVTVGPDTVIGPHAYVERDTRIGRGYFIAKGAVLGTDPQDLKYEGEETRLVIGDDTTIREYATLNRGTRATGSTEVGSGCLLMAYSHIAHDCRIGDHVIISNAVNMGGHVVIEDWATVGGVTAIHQFVRIGTHAFVGGGSRVPKDIAPYTRAAGNPCRTYGLNTVGLERRGFTAEARLELKRAYRAVFSSDVNVGQAVRELRATGKATPEVERFLRFIEDSERGITL